MRELIVELRGGFGNQLFQWGTALALRAIFEDTEVIFDEGRVVRPLAQGNALEAFGLRVRTRRHMAVQVAARLLEGLPTPLRGALSARLPNPSPVLGAREASSFEEARTLLQRHARVRLRGYVQELEPILSVRSEMRRSVREVLAPKGPAEISAPGGVVVHVRRGDYLIPSNAHIGACSPLYYVNAVALMPSVKYVVIVSDDASWCRDQLVPRFSLPCQVRDTASFSEDFAFLCRAERLVASNSTFSWWACFLSDAVESVGPVPWMDRGGDSMSLSRIFDHLAQKHPRAA